MDRNDLEKRWMAYMDGQMTASEALDFERSLSARDRARLDGEVRLESAISDGFSGGPCCPATLWKDLAATMAQPAPAKIDRIVYWASRTTIVLAATAAIVLSAPYVEQALTGGGQAPASGIAIEEDTREAFASGLLATSSYTEAEQFLRENNINVHLTGSGGNTGHPHDLEFLGVCRGRCPEGTLYELRFWCCGKPVKILIARRGTDGERVLKGAFRCGDAAETIMGGEYVTAFVGDHSSHALEHMLKPVRGNIV